jgi:hypothetical protein
MKVRISGNGIRFRLKQPEVESFARSGKIVEHLQFGPREEDCLKFQLEKSPCEKIDASFAKNSVTVYIPEMESNEWTDTQIVGIEGKVVNEGIVLSVLIEKDFACIDGNSEENAGTYPNPLTNCKTENADQR